MTPDQMKQLASRLQTQAEIANFDGAFPELVHVADEAAMYLKLVAPYMDSLMPLITGEFRRTVERRQLDVLRAEVERLVDLIRKLRHPSGANLAAEIEADRLCKDGRHA